MLWLSSSHFRKALVAAFRLGAFGLGVLGLGALVLACSAQGRTVEDRWGWDYCAPPYPPECLESARATRKIDAICRTAVDTYVANVVRYRTCLAGELERAMREANDVIDSAKCLTDKANCPERKP